MRASSRRPRAAGWCGASAGRIARLGAALVTVGLAARVSAQSPGQEVACDGQLITAVRITAEPPYAGRQGRWWQTPARLANAIHSTTRPAVVKRFLLLDEGDQCTERKRAESERILRAQPFIAQARVATESDGHGGVILVVDTRDELTPVLNVRASGGSPYLDAVTLGDGNVLGSGTYAAATWGDGIFRDRYAAHITDYQFLGRPYMLDAFGERGDAGISSWSIEAAHRYLTDLQRIAWRVSAGDRNELFDFQRGVLDPVRVGITRQYFDVGSIVRIGPPGQLGLVGLSLTGESDEAGLPPVPDTGVDYSALLPQFHRRSNTRVNVLWGLRNLDYLPVERFDALSAEQDMPAGFQFGAQVGRSVRGFGATDDDILVAGDLYAGVGNSHTFATLQASGEGRQNLNDKDWDGVIGSAKLTVYDRIRPQHTFVTSLSWGGGWKSPVPLQLRLGEPDVGVRGYGASHDAGARRAVARLEDRWYLGSMRQQADLGLAFFADAGRVWAGDAPFGVTTPVRVGAGLSLLAAVPAGSKRTWRVDVAFPLSPDGQAKWEVRVTSVNVLQLGIGHHEPRDIRRSREIAVPSSVYEWP
ncbi:MAG TPA: hypothetical protein VF166_15195 [Gemmatimonadaceae bacterium]